MEVLDLADWEIARAVPESLRLEAHVGAQALLSECAEAYRFAARILRVETELYRVLEPWRDKRVDALYPVYFCMAYYYGVHVDDHQYTLQMDDQPPFVTPEEERRIRWWGWFRAEIKRHTKRSSFIRCVCELAGHGDAERRKLAAASLRAYLDEDCVPGERDLETMRF